MNDEKGMMIVGAFAGTTVACGFLHRSNYWGVFDRGSQLDDGCCVVRHSWSGTA